jgi:preprotein translocase subunit SecG
MLSFMREQEMPGSSPETGAGGAGSSSSDEGYLTVSTRANNVRKTTSMLVVLFIIGVISLWFMIKKSSPQAASAAGDPATETQIETAISRLTGIKAEMFSRMDEIVEKFYEFSDVQQIKVSELAKNPFSQEVLWANLRKPSDNDDALMRQQNMQLQAKGLRLLSIMQSEQGNCCMIDDQILREGDMIKGFTVRRIGETSVALELEQNQSEKLQIVLKLSE